MIVLELLVNDELVATAGAEDLSVLGASVTALGKLGKESHGTKLKEEIELRCEMGGLTSRTKEPKNVHFTWYGSDKISIGDEITIRVRESNTVDAPLQATEEAIKKQIESNKRVERERYESAKKYYLENKDKYEI